MDLETLNNELKSQRELLEKIYKSVESTRKYFLYTTIVTVVLIVLPLIAMVFVIPMFLSAYSDLLGGGLGI